MLKFYQIEQWVIWHTGINILGGNGLALDFIRWKYTLQSISKLWYSGSVSLKTSMFEKFGNECTYWSLEML
jgi:hypothetical protein